MHTSLRSTFTSLAGAVVVAAAVALTPTAALANDAYLAYGAFAADFPGAETVGVEGAASQGVIFSPGGTVLGAGAEGNPFGTSALLYSFTAGQTASIAFVPGVGGFGFSYESTAAVSASVFAPPCITLGGPPPCVLSGDGFFGVGIADFPILGSIELTAQTDGQLLIGDFQIAGDMSTVPEPGTVALLGTGILGLGGFGVARRRRAASLA